jgi:anti-sigma regulatory factor (Ser/Thr protein kinase)
MSAGSSNTAELQVTIRNKLDELPRLNSVIHSFLEARAVPQAAVFAVHLATEEMITNIIKYGYDDRRTHDIAVKVAHESGRLLIRIEDDGHEFNPLAAPPPDTSAQLEKRKIGGLGIHLVCKTVSEIHYQRIGGCNRLDMVIRL